MKQKVQVTYEMYNRTLIDEQIIEERIFKIGCAAKDAGRTVTEKWFIRQYAKRDYNEFYKKIPYTLIVTK